KYGVSVAYYFIGYIKDNEGLYDNLRRNGFTLIFKEVSRDENDKPKGNIDAELVLQAMIDIEKYGQAVIVTSDGDFACLVKYLITQNKFLKVLASSRHGCSKLLGKAAGANIDFLDDLRQKLEYKY
ncbi:MAG: NYN domain-containing protein, partial [Dehalococcoidia bacterium]|nr:NYN domain-containing protein [Dehalococcoidia bacterium]